MSFEEFQNRSRLYVIGALEPDEIDAFEEARKQFGQKAEDFISECYALHEAFARSRSRSVSRGRRSALLGGRR